MYVTNPANMAVSIINNDIMSLENRSKFQTVIILLILMLEHRPKYQNIAK